MAFRGDWLSHLSKLCKLTIFSVDSIKPLTTCGHSTKADLIQGGERKRKESFIPKDFHMSVKNVRKMLKFIVFHKGFIFWYLEFSVHDLNTQCCLLLCYKTITRANIFTKVVWNKPTFPAKASILGVHIVKCNIYQTFYNQNWNKIVYHLVPTSWGFLMFPLLGRQRP